MKLHRLEIQRFRGIRELSWNVGGDFVCLFGPGDSTKTTILDAIELVLSPRWSVPFDDTDFFEGKTDEPILITATVGGLPEELKSDNRFGLFTRGWSAGGELHDEPENGDELVLSIRLLVGSDLEPHWVVVNDRDEEGRQIGHRDRERLGCGRVGDYLDRHFAWGRGSILSQLTADSDGLGEALATAARAARSVIEKAKPTGFRTLESAAEKVRKAGEAVGVAPREDYHPHLDVKSVAFGVGGLSLHDGEIPLRRAGLGTRRLLAIAMQREAGQGAELTLIDEVEQGLEPHRLRHLLRFLRRPEGQNPTHIIMTTHSPIVLGELNAKELRLVRSINGKTMVVPVVNDLQAIVRTASEAFLALKVLVCEGKTELGFCRGLDTRWGAELGRSFALSGVALADGGGQKAAAVAHGFLHLGYGVALLGDSDKALKPDEETLRRAGASVFLWEGGVCIEQRLFLDLPWVGVIQLLEIAIEEHDEGPIRDSVHGAFRGEPLPSSVSDWDESPDLRTAIGNAAKGFHQGKGWFKRVDLGERVAEVVMRHWKAVSEAPLGRNIEALRAWAHER